MLTEEQVVFAYKLLLGRNPESEEIIRNYVRHCSIDDLRRRILGSGEFIERMLSGSDRGEVSWFEFGQLEGYRSTGRRLEHLTSLDLRLWGKSVLEVGAGAGLLSSFFVDRMCKVLVTDASASAISLARSFYNSSLQDVQRNNVSFEIIDFDTPIDWSQRPRKQVVICYDAFWQAKACRTFLHNLSAACEEILLLETRVAFGHHEELFAVPDQDLRTESSVPPGAMVIPTRKWLWQRLSDSFPFVYTPLTQPWLDSFPTNWDLSNQHSAFGRSIFIASRVELENHVLVRDLLSKQTRAD
jgi:2-polyprenyl-3-methyl-5-hydroxy-6-metoxy-1,4-benzoquinol methylase